MRERFGPAGASTAQVTAADLEVLKLDGFRPQVFLKDCPQHVASLLFIDFSDPAQLMISHSGLQKLARIITNPCLT
jgi:hypothetical protein